MWQSLREAMAEHIREQFPVYMLTLIIFTAGVALGAVSVRMLPESQVHELNQYFFSFLDYLLAGKPVNQALVLRKALWQNGVFVAFLWFFGNFFFGFVPVLGLLFYRGFAIGFTVGFLVQQNFMHGILFAMGAILPQNLVYVPVSILASVCAVIFSFMLLKRRMTGRAFPYRSWLLQFSLLMVLALALLSAGSLIEALITPVFMRAIVTAL